MPKNIIILQHIPIETPGYILDLMMDDKMNLTTIELDAGEKIPENLSKFDAMLCMGGPMDTWMVQEYPWLVDEKKKIHEFVIKLKKRQKSIVPIHSSSRVKVRPISQYFEQFFIIRYKLINLPKSCQNLLNL